jgi:hypothetical protein
MASAPFILTQSRDLSMKKILVAMLAIMSERIESRSGAVNFAWQIRRKSAKWIRQLRMLFSGNECADV